MNIENVIWGPINIFDFVSVRLFSPGGFFTFSVVVAHGAPRAPVNTPRQLIDDMPPIEY